MKSVAYVDGYNLYYRRLRNTPYKWLNVWHLIKHILHVQEPVDSLTKLVFCTAGIKARFASHGQDSVEAQSTYHRALKSVGVEIVLGQHTKPEKAKLPKARPHVHHPDPSDVVEVWRMEEKQTDVNLALGMYRDAMSDDYDQVVLVSSDTDLVPALLAIQEDAPQVRRGLILPRHPIAARPPARSLSALCHWTRDHINDDELEAALFSKSRTDSEETCGQTCALVTIAEPPQITCVLRARRQTARRTHGSGLVRHARRVPRQSQMGNFVFGNFEPSPRRSKESFQLF